MDWMSIRLVFAAENHFTLLNWSNVYWNICNLFSMPFREKKGRHKKSQGYDPWKRKSSRFSFTFPFSNTTIDPSLTFYCVMLCSACCCHYFLLKSHPHHRQRILWSTCINQKYSLFGLQYILTLTLSFLYSLWLIFITLYYQISYLSW